VPDNLEWAQAFLRQALLDLDAAMSIQKALVTRIPDVSAFSRDSAQYHSIILAHYQQAIEKALKAVVLVVRGKTRKLLDHNPIRVVWDSPGDSLVRKVLLEYGIVHQRDVPSLRDALDSAPGAPFKKGNKIPLDDLLKQRNSEYPYEVGAKVVLPWESISHLDLVKAKRLAGSLIGQVEKYVGKQVSGARMAPPP
jgi:hypothetical protein